MKLRLPVKISKKSRKWFRNKRHLYMVTVLIVLAAGLTALGFAKTQHDVVSITPAPGPTVAATVPNPLELSVTWLPVPSPLADLKLVSLEGASAAQKTSYYQVGTVNDGRQVVLAVTSGPVAVPPMLLVHETDNTYSYLVRHNNLNTANNDYVTGVLLNRQVGLDTAHFISAIDFQPTLAYGDAVLETSKSYDYTQAAVNYKSDYARPAIRDNTGTLYEVTNKVGKGYNVVSYFKVGPDFRARTYRVRLPLDYVSGVLQATWQDGHANTDSYERALVPCQLITGDAIATTITDFDLDETGRLANGNKVFILKSNDAVLQKTLYQTYLDYRKQIGGDVSGNLDPESFRTSRAVVIVKDKLDRYVILPNQNILPNQGC